MINNKYYIFAPANICSGGPEALHQLAFYMRECGLESYVIYYTNSFVDSETHKRYQQYKPHVIKYEEIEDHQNNYCIASENAPWCLNGIFKAKKCIWWLGLQLNEVHRVDFKTRIVYYKRKLFKQTILLNKGILFNDNKCLHFCGSKYAYQYVSHIYPAENVFYLVEPISKDFLDNNSIINKIRKDIVLYNPAKPSDRMNLLLNRGKFKFVPLKGYTPLELIQKYIEAKLYVDFGYFGGPERMPKEAAYWGCNLLVANHNAASNDFDVAIPSNYKIDDNESIEVVEEMIQNMLNNYEEHNVHFIFFKDKVRNLEQNFIQQIKEIFIDENK